jgi:long-chain acyl-CoA synthetase
VVKEIERLKRASKATATPAPRAGREAAQKWVLDIVAAVAQRPAGQVSPEQRLVEDLGLDSLGLTEVAAALEGAGVVLHDGVESELKEATVARLAEVVAAAKRTARTGGPSKKRGEDGKAGGEADLPVPKLVADMGFRLLRAGQKALYDRFLDVKISGSEHVPIQGAFIVASNHTSHLDMGLVKHALGAQGERMSALAARDYFFDKPLKRAYFGHFTNLLPMEREGSIRESLRLAAQALRRGRHLLIFPEGTRSLDGELMPFLPSVGYLALSNQVDILPMYLAGTHEAMPKGTARIERKPLRVAIGAAIRFRDYGPLVAGMPRSLAYRAVTALVEDAVHALRDGRPRGTMAEVIEAARNAEAAETNGQVVAVAPAANDRDGGPDEAAPAPRRAHEG